MGQMSVSKEQFDKAEGYLSDAVKGLTETKDLYKAYILLGHSQAARKAYSAARSSFYKAAEIDPTKGEPYMQIANLYAQSARMVDDGMNGRSVYWAAVDMARQATKHDVSDATAEAVSKMVSTFSAYFPKKTDAFMLNLIDGQSYTVGSWIGASTVVRTR
jgi:tetratricopeptide (TPR) repeat protein